MFGFPKSKINKKDNFKSNYLQSVTFQVDFIKTKNVKENQEKIVEILKEKIPEIIVNKTPHRNIDIEHTKINLSFSENLNLTTTDNHTALVINEGMLCLIIHGSAYQNFEMTSKLLSLIPRIMLLCKINNLIRIAIRKINLVDFQLQNANTSNYLFILNSFFNENLVSNTGHIPSEHVQKNIYSLVLKNEPYNLNLNYGLLSVSKPDKGKLLLDIDLFNMSELHVKDLQDEFKKINDEIFNIFTWALNEDSLSKMGGF